MGLNQKVYFKNGTKSNATILATFIIGLIAGPAVSLYGSPTVSPVTAALWVSEPLPPNLPVSIYFLALSQAAPPLVIEIATNIPVTIVPTNIPPRATGPSKKPTITGAILGLKQGSSSLFGLLWLQLKHKR